MFDNTCNYKWQIKPACDCRDSCLDQFKNDITVEIEI